jgi:hypothetical protein
MARPVRSAGNKHAVGMAGIATRLPPMSAMRMIGVADPLAAHARGLGSSERWF